jgi:hypothetical protein
LRNLRNLNKSKILLSICFTSIFIFLIYSVATPYVVQPNRKWPVSKATSNPYYVNTLNVPTRINNFPAIVNAAVKIWNDVPTSYFNFTYKGVNNNLTYTGSTDGKNSFSWRKKWSGIDNDTLATNYYWTLTSTGEMVEYDIVIFDDSRLVWQANPSYGRYDVQSILSHEAGHSLYLGHSEFSQAIMYAFYNGRRTLHQDDINGITFLYPRAGVTPTPTPTTTSTVVPVDSGGGGGGGCFIATAAFGSYIHKDVITLRNFRDSVLLKSTPGRSFVESYYRISPPIAGYISTRPHLRATVRCVLTPMIILIRYPAATAVLILISALILTLFVKRRQNVI